MEQDEQRLPFLDLGLSFKTALASRSRRFVSLKGESMASEVQRDGQPLGRGILEEDLSVDSLDALLKSRWTVITREEHPYLNRPWYKIHPCRTREWIKLLFLSDGSVSTRGAAIELYLISWFSVVGPVFGLSDPLGMMNKEEPFLSC